jgi:hypothetical protein
MSNPVVFSRAEKRLSRKYQNVRARALKKQMAMEDKAKREETNRQWGAGLKSRPEG